VGHFGGKDKVHKMYVITDKVDIDRQEDKKTKYFDSACSCMQAQLSLELLQHEDKIAF